MASLIEGYEYDIFISYRQKDNKHDGWVTEFVNNLIGELESTFKEEISVYFDINPHDGLLETHDVDESLKDKLKCLIFIPIISRTYCDPNSFAWVHEFKAFIDVASNDKFGLKIKLPGGNVANRMLPIQIHDLDADDKKLVKNELGGFLRGIEFIYKEPGVNRPLTQNDDEKRNLNNTKYKNQINKVANAVKEIISGIKNYSLKGRLSLEEIVEHSPRVVKNYKAKIIAGSLILLALLVAGYFIVSKLYNSEKSIAVLPFDNWNSDEEFIYLGDAIADEIILQLQNMNVFDRVISRSSTMQFKENRPAIPEIANKLGVKYIIEGSIQRQKDNVIIRVQVIRAKHEKHVWGNKYNEKWEDILNIMNDIARKVAEGLKIALTPSEIEKIKEKPTSNMEAYNLYLKGRYFWEFRGESSLLKAIDFFKEAIKLDSTYALAYTGLADSYIMLPWYSSTSKDVYIKAKLAAEKALEVDYLLGEAYATMGFIKYSKWEFESAEEYYIRALELAPNYANAHLWYAMLLACTARYDKAIDEILTARNLDPLGLVINRNTGFIYISAKQYDNGIEALKKVIEMYPNFISVHYQLSRAYLNKGLFEEALYENQISGEKIWTGIIYANIGQLEKAQQILNDIIISSKSQIISPFELAILYFSLGNEEQGFNNLEIAYDVHDLRLTEIRMYPELDKYLSHPRFRSILKKMGINN